MQAPVQTHNMGAWVDASHQIKRTWNWEGCTLDTYLATAAACFPSPPSHTQEAVHETGHVLGLGHCRAPCVMAFSNSRDEARHKGRTLCDSCQARLARLHSSKAAAAAAAPMDDTDDEAACIS